MARRSQSEDNIGLILILGAGGFALWQWLKSKGMATVNMPGTVTNPSGGGNVLIGEARGIRNNNPGNIKYSSANNWQGQTGSDGTFATFSSPVYGFRALFMLARTYINTHGLDTLDKFGPRWTATDQAAWRSNVAINSGIPQNAKLNFNDKAQMIRLARGIVVAENGVKYKNYYSDSVIGSGYDAA